MTQHKDEGLAPHICETDDGKRCNICGKYLVPPIPAAAPVSGEAPLTPLKLEEARQGFWDHKPCHSLGPEGGEAWVRRSDAEEYAELSIGAALLARGLDSAAPVSGEAEELAREIMDIFDADIHKSRTEPTIRKIAALLRPRLERAERWIPSEFCRCQVPLHSMSPEGVTICTTCGLVSVEVLSASAFADLHKREMEEEWDIYDLAECYAREFHSLMESKQLRQEKALRRLRTEVLGILGMAKEQMRDVIGNTNIAVLQQRLDEAYAVLPSAPDTEKK